MTLKPHINIEDEPPEIWVLFDLQVRGAGARMNLIRKSWGSLASVAWLDQRHAVLAIRVGGAEASVLTSVVGGSEGRRPQEREQSGELRVFTAAELLAEDLPPVRWTVPGLLPEGVTLLAGNPKLGKSWLALGLAVAVASGGTALGARQVERGDVLYLGLEDNRRRLQKRLRKILAGRVAPEGLYIATEWSRMDEGGTEPLERWPGGTQRRGSGSWISSSG